VELSGGHEPRYLVRTTFKFRVADPNPKPRGSLSFWDAGSGSALQSKFKSCGGVWLEIELWRAVDAHNTDVKGLLVADMYYFDESLGPDPHQS
jgi:hypothetical protein